MFRSIDELNMELQEASDEIREQIIQLMYEELILEQYRLLELEQYAEDCADADAQYYGEM